MKGKKRTARLLAVVLGLGGVSFAARALDAGMVEEMSLAIESAETEIGAARSAIERGKQLVARIPEDSSLVVDVQQMLEAAAENWSLAVDSLNGARQSAEKVATATNEALAADFLLLAKVNAAVAMSGAKVVQIGLQYVEAVADNKTEALGIIRTSMQDALAAASQVQFNYERVKTIIAQKYTSQ